MAIVHREETIGKYIAFMYAVKHNSDNKVKFSKTELAKKFSVDASLLTYAKASGMVSKNGIGYVFLKPITFNTISELLDFATKSKREKEIKRVEEMKRKSEQPESFLFNVNAEEERMCKEAEEFLDMMANPTISYAPVIEHPKPENKEIADEPYYLAGTTSTEMKIDDLIKYVRNIERMLINLGCK